MLTGDKVDHDEHLQNASETDELAVLKERLDGAERRASVAEALLEEWGWHIEDVQRLPPPTVDADVLDWLKGPGAGPLVAHERSCAPPCCAEDDRGLRFACDFRAD